MRSHLRTTKKEGYVLIEITILLLIISVLILTFDNAKMSFMNTIDKLNNNTDKYANIDMASDYIVKMINRANQAFIGIKKEPVFMRKEDSNNIIYYYFEKSENKGSKLLYKGVGNLHQELETNTIRKLKFSDNKLMDKIDSLEINYEDKVFSVTITSDGFEITKFVTPFYEVKYE